jgi:hypothetical protein
MTEVQLRPTSGLRVNQGSGWPNHDRIGLYAL